MLWLWLIVFVICIIYGPSFLSLTKSDLDIPADSPAAKARNAFSSNYPSTSGWSPVILVLHSQTQANIVGPFSRAFDKTVATFAAKHSDVIASTSSYYQLIANP